MTAMFFLFPILGTGALLRGSIDADNSPPSPHIEIRQPQLTKRMNNNPQNPQALPGQPPPDPYHVHQEAGPPVADQDFGVPGVNLPCGWLDGLTADGEIGVVSGSFYLNPGRYMLNIRWTRRPNRAGAEACVTFWAIQPLVTISERFPATCMAEPLVVTRRMKFEVSLTREVADNENADPEEDVVNDAEIIWWLERVPAGRPGDVTSAGSQNIVQNEERPTQRQRLNR